MSKRSDPALIADMLEACQDVAAFCSGRAAADLAIDRQFTLALVKAIEIVGEAARAVSPQLKQRHIEVPWREIIGMRHRLVHDYASINLQIVWNVATVDVPALLSQLQVIAAEIDAE